MLQILTSAIEPRNLILCTAQKFIEAELDKEADRHLRNVIREYLNALNPEMCDIRPLAQELEATEVDEG